MAPWCILALGYVGFGVAIFSAAVCIPDVREQAAEIWGRSTAATRMAVVFIGPLVWPLFFFPSLLARMQSHAARPKNRFVKIEGSEMAALCCDICGQIVETPPGCFSSRILIEWQSGLHDDGWGYVCPTCRRKLVQ